MKFPFMGPGTVMNDNREMWHQDKTEKGHLLVDAITELSERARAAGFHTTAYILELAATELTKDIDKKI
jgi:hypothetical protein